MDGVLTIDVLMKENTLFIEFGGRAPYTERKIKKAGSDDRNHDSLPKSRTGHLVAKKQVFQFCSIPIAFEAPVLTTENQI